MILSGSEAIPIEEDHRQDAAANCAVAAVMYGVFVVVSAGCIFYKGKTGKEKLGVHSRNEQSERDPLVRGRNTGFKSAKVRTESPHRKRENSFDMMIGSPEQKASTRANW